MLPESFTLILFCWGVAVSSIILGDNTAFHKDWPNVKIKLVGIIFSGASALFSVIPQRFDLATSTNTIVYFNKTVDITAVTASAGTPLDFTRFIVSILLTVICAADLLVNLSEDPC